MSATKAAIFLETLAARKTVEQSAMIVVAHPDDETIGMGAQLCRFRSALLIQVTDGAPRDGRDAAMHGYASVADYAAARRAELAVALEAGEARGLRTELIGIPDQEACFHLAALIEQIAERVRGEAPQVIFIQPYEGGHPDHDGAAFAVHAGCRLIAAEGGRAPALVEMTGYHADGAGLATGSFLGGRPRVTTIALNQADRLRKRRMIDCFASQRDLLAGFGTEVERFRAAPDYDFTQPPHPGELHYERLGWGVTGALWRQQSRSALEALGLVAS